MRRGAAVLAAVLALAALVGCEDRRDPVSQAVGWFPPSEQANARCIVWHETRNRPDVVGAAGELGLFQIHPVHRRWVTALTGEPWPTTARSTLNGQVAFVLWKQTGWRAWSTARVCGLR